MQKHERTCFCLNNPVRRGVFGRGLRALFSSGCLAPAPPPFRKRGIAAPKTIPLKKLSDGFPQSLVASARGSRPGEGAFKVFPKSFSYT